jgi:hypothetical protein
MHASISASEPIGLPLQLVPRAAKPPKFTHARHDPDLCLTPGLFTSLQKGVRAREKLSASYTVGKRTLEFRGPEPLGVDDMRCLQGLVAMAGSINAPTLTQLSNDPLAAQLWSDLTVDGPAAEQQAILIHGSYADVCALVGWSKNGARQVRACVERLYTVSVFVEEGAKRSGYRILSFVTTDEARQTLAVALNPTLTAVILNGGKHTRIDMAEVRALQTDPARLLHQRLSAFIDPGKSRNLRLETLSSYIWHERASEAAQRKRLQRARTAAFELRTELGWTVQDCLADQLEIGRPIYKA